MCQEKVDKDIMREENPLRQNRPMDIPLELPQQRLLERLQQLQEQQDLRHLLLVSPQCYILHLPINGRYLNIKFYKVAI